MGVGSKRQGQGGGGDSTACLLLATSALPSWALPEGTPARCALDVWTSGNLVPWEVAGVALGEGATFGRGGGVTSRDSPWPPGPSGQEAWEELRQSFWPSSVAAQRRLPGRMGTRDLGLQEVMTKEQESRPNPPESLPRASWEPMGLMGLAPASPVG